MSAMSPVTTGASLRKRVFRLVRLAVLAVTLPLFLIPVAMGGLSMYSLVRAGCDSGYQLPSAYGLQYQAFAFPSRLGGTYRALFVPGVKSSDSGNRDSATIIFTPAFAGDAAKMLYEAAPLAKAGFNTVLYESRACVGRTMSMGYRDTEDIEDLLAYLQTNSDGIRVNMERLALHGFSEGGVAAIMGGARLKTIKAVLAEGGFNNFIEHVAIKDDSTILEKLMLLSTQATYRVLTGDDISVLNPEAAVKGIPPRALFLIYGSREISLPGARRQLANARAMETNSIAELWVVPNADHGGYIDNAGVTEYVRQTSAFYDCVLLDRCSAWKALYGR